ncbi:MAG: type II toxin-antitoxin system antitoxin SocA domain-containing protein [Pseudomonadota bacterium]
MRDSAKIANRFLTLAHERNDSLTPMQLLKLVYIAHGWGLGLYGVPLIRDEVQAWQYGPVIPRLYNKTRKFKSLSVTGHLPSEEPEGLTARETDLINQVYQHYGSMSGPALSRITHAIGTPWELTYKPGSFGIVIPNDLIEDHYSRLANQNR